MPALPATLSVELMMQGGRLSNRSGCTPLVNEHRRLEAGHRMYMMEALALMAFGGKNRALTRGR